MKIFLVIGRNRSVTEAILIEASEKLPCSHC